MKKIHCKGEHARITDLRVKCHHITAAFVLLLFLIPTVCCFFDCLFGWLGIIFLPVIIWCRLRMSMPVFQCAIFAFVTIFTTTDSFAYTAADLLSAAAKGELEKVVKIIKEKPAASKKGTASKVEKINIDCKGNDGRTPLMLASYWGRIDVAKNLIENKANINVVDIDGASALSLAVSGKKNDVCQYLIKQKADVNIKDTYGQNALLRAIQCDNTEIIGPLLDAGADVNVQDNGGNTPLIIAVQKKQIAIVELLIKKGADVNKRDKKNKTAMDYAGNNTKLKTLLSTDKTEPKK